MMGSMPKFLFILLLVYAAASLVHFIHNAEFLGDYPNLPMSWSRGKVYVAWAVMTAVGAVGALLMARGYQMAGLLIITVYACFGLDSIGHYVLAPLSAHTFAMNATILLEVGSAAVLFVVVIALMARRVRANRG